MTNVAEYINNYLLSYITKFIVFLFLFASKYNTATHKTQLEAICAYFTIHDNKPQMFSWEIP